jgi:8-oxo-dGTP diphosphatase
MTEVKFYDPSYLPSGRLIYSVVAARTGDKWIFVRHQARTTWEMAAGHIEINEEPFETAERELVEETGAINFNIECIATYSVTDDKGTGFGRLYYAEVTELGPVNDRSEIAEVRLMDHLPENLTYPDIQPCFFSTVTDYLKRKGNTKYTRN